MPQYIINLTDAEDMALSSVALSQEEWIVHAAKERARVATESIMQLVVQKCLEEGVQIPSSKDEMVTLAFQKGWEKTVVQKNAEAEALRQSMRQA